MRFSPPSGLTPSAFVESALSQFLSGFDDLAEETRRWEGFERDGKFVAAVEVDAWIDSLGAASASQKPPPRK